MVGARGRGMSRLWRDDEEMAKKDDDLKLPSHAKRPGQWQGARAPRRTSVVRAVAYIVILVLIVYLLCSAFGGPSTEADQRGYPFSSNQGSRFDAPKPRPVGVPDNRNSGGSAKAIETAARTYDEPVKFPTLGSTLRYITETGGSQPKNRNVLFAAASLKSVSELMPLACDMAEQLENYVHFLFLGRSLISMKELLEVNGVDEKCQIIVHDGRPDSPDISTDQRMGIATARAFFHIESYMHPQAMFVDSTAKEEPYFLFGVRDQTRSMRGSLVELPESPSSRFSWIARLDSAALYYWNSVNFDIIIQVPPTGTANLERLLKSFSGADLGGIEVPHITIELPESIEEPTQNLVGGFKWPPSSVEPTTRSNMFSMRHRIPRAKMDEEESAVRFFESFWPARPSTSHVLVFSPHTEITPQFFHYVKYSLLKYRYSAAALAQGWTNRLMGMGFAAPTTLLDGSSPLSIPQGEDADSTSSFVWQGPTSDAMLFFGDKWVELHGFASQLLEKAAALGAKPAMLEKKEIGHQKPAWLEYVLQLSRARGYFTLYPSQETANTILGVHSELNDIPEEYQDTGEVTDEEAEEGIRAQAHEEFNAGTSTNMMSTLPEKGKLPPLSGLPLLSWNGERVKIGDLGKEQGQYATQFRSEVGQCTDEADPDQRDKYARDLFCKT